MSAPKQSSLASFFTGVKKKPIQASSEPAKPSSSSSSSEVNNPYKRKVDGTENEGDGVNAGADAGAGGAVGAVRKESPSKKLKTDAGGTSGSTSGSTSTSVIATDTTTMGTEDTMSITDPSWAAALSKAQSTSSYAKLMSFLATERSRKAIFPPPNETFSAFNLTPLSIIKVVIVGQDPYHGLNQGHGLSFSVKPGVAIPPSLRNIYKELQSEGLLTKKPDHGYLKSWAEQGVFMLNAVLSVRQGEANSHAKKGWEEFTTAAINYLSKEKDGLVFLCWGKPAANMCASVNKSKHLVITSSHPSPLGATKTDKPFIGSDCFKRCNDFLTKNGKEGVEWDSVNK